MRTKEKSTTLYFIRHGQADYPTDRIYCDDKEDPALTTEGQRQAQAAAQYFKPVPIDAIYASPTRRTRTTADEIAKVLNKPVTISPQLQERRFGQWEGKYFNEIETQYPEAYQQWKADKLHYTPPQGETILALQARVTEYIGSLIAQHIGGNLAVVSHVGPIRMWVASAFELPLHQYRQINISYASISKIDYGQTLNNLMFLNYCHNGWPEST